MSVPKINTNANGEQSEYLEGGTMRSISPAINLELQLSCKDSSVDTHLPDAFRPKPKISRTPPNSNETKGNPQNSSNIVITIDNDDITDESKFDYDDDPGYIHDSGTYQSQSSKNINSPSLSIEYPPGSSIPMVKKRKKFQFKKSHYQRFIGTSSAKKTKELRKNIIRNRSRSNSLISYQSSAAIIDNELIKAHNDFNDKNNNNITKMAQESLPPSPPSDDIISTLSQMINKTPNKLPHHIVTNSAHIAVLPKRRKSNKSMDSDEITVSSSPSLLETTNTTTTTATATNGYSSPYQYRSRQQWTTLIHSQVQKRQEIEKQNASSKATTSVIKTPLASTRSNYRPKKSTKTPTFGGNCKSDGNIDPDKIRIALNKYDQQKGQNLEEIFKPQKRCFNCVIL